MGEEEHCSLLSLWADQRSLPLEKALRYGQQLELNHYTSCLPTSFLPQAGYPSFLNQ